MNYLSNKNLLPEIETSIGKGQCTEELGRMFLLLAKKYSDKGSFSGYSYKDDMIGEAVYTCLRYMHNFKVEKDNPNPFAYFSKVIHNSFLLYISQQKKHSKIKDVCYKNLDVIMPEFNDEDEHSFFEISAINYQPIMGNKKKRKRRKKNNR